MESNFRQSMRGVHTWFGLVLGYVLMACFFFGSLSVFDREFDRWAVPETRFEPQPMPSFDTMLRPIFETIEPDEDELAAARARVGGPLAADMPLMTWSAYTTHRDPVLSLYAEYAVTNNPNDPFDHVHGHVTIDPRDGSILPHDALDIGTHFFYPMHYSLHLEWKGLGYWLVGLAALMMLAALVSGVVIHRKLFREFFTLRPDRHTLRSVLDVHNLSGVVALPFHFMFALTGLVIFAGIYLPVDTTQLEPQATAFAQAEAEASGLAFAPADQPAPLASVDAMVTEAKRRWEARGMPGEVGFLYLNHVGDANGYVSIYRAGSDRVALVGQAVHFRAATGAVIREEAAPTPVQGIAEFLTGLHLQHFRHWLLRWLYVFGGLSGCACIATGLIFFVEKRKRRHAESGLGGARWADAFAVSTVTGMVVATTAMLLANRVLPEALPHRGDWQERIFWLAWLLSFVHAAWRSSAVRAGLPSPAWREQCWTIALLATGAVVANAVTTGDHLLATLATGNWPVAGVDLSLLATATISLLAARRLSRRAQRSVDAEATRTAGRSTTADAAHA